jgi:hypothetical protein
MISASNVAFPPVAHHADRFHRQHPQQPAWMSGRKPQREMPTPGMSHDQCLRPAKTVEDGDRVVDRLSDRERAFQSRGLKAALLVGRYAEFRRQLNTRVIHVRVAKTRPAVKQ